MNCLGKVGETFLAAILAQLLWRGDASILFQQSCSAGYEPEQSGAKTMGEVPQRAAPASG